jgi:hypothetical protein
MVGLGKTIIMNQKHIYLDHWVEEGKEGFLSLLLMSGRRDLT